VLLVATPAPASSQDPSTREVEVVLVGAIGREATLPERIRSWFDPRKFVVAVRTSDTLDVGRVLGPSRDRAAHVWITSSRPEHARFYFALASENESTTLYLMRDLPLEHGVDELAAERIAQVCFLSTIALVEGQAESRKADIEKSLRAEQAASAERAASVGSVGAEGGSPEPGAGSADEPRALATNATVDRSSGDAAQGTQRSPSTSRHVFQFGVGYGVSLRGDEGTGHGPRGNVAARFRTFGIFVLVQSDLPTTTQLDRLDLELYALSSVLGVEVRRNFHDLTLALHAGPSLDVVHYDPHPTDSAVRAGATATEARPGMDIGTSVEFGPPLPRFAIVADLAVPFSRTHYDLVEGSRRVVVGRAWPVVPIFGAELRF
jgi:hypothetical protein